MPGPALASLEETCQFFWVTPTDPRHFLWCHTDVSRSRMPCALALTYQRPHCFGVMGVVEEGRYVGGGQTGQPIGADPAPWTRDPQHPHRQSPLSELLPSSPGFAAGTHWGCSTASGPG